MKLLFQAIPMAFVNKGQKYIFHIIFLIFPIKFQFVIELHDVNIALLLWHLSSCKTLILCEISCSILCVYLTLLHSVGSQQSQEGV